MTSWVSVCESYKGAHIAFHFFVFFKRHKLKGTNTHTYTQSLTLDPHGKSFFHGVKFSVQTISRGRVA